jgi:hypothetical protein
MSRAALGPEPPLTVAALSPELDAQVEGVVQLALGTPRPSRAVLSEAVRALACAGSASAGAGP